MIREKEEPVISMPDLNAVSSQPAQTDLTVRTAIDSSSPMIPGIRTSPAMEEVAAAFTGLAQDNPHILNRMNLVEQQLRSQLGDIRIIAVYRDANSNDPARFHRSRGDAQSPVEYWLVTIRGEDFLVPRPHTPGRFMEVSGRIFPQAGSGGIPTTAGEWPILPFDAQRMLPLHMAHDSEGLSEAIAGLPRVLQRLHPPRRSYRNMNVIWDVIKL